MSTDLTTDLADLVEAASDGDITRDDALDAEAPLVALGLTSLGQLRLIQAVERAYGVRLDLDDDPVYLDGVGPLASYLRARGVPG
ncbi:acyl carrier protein [Micromonospora sp. NPDC051300]|uniref:acyl carrier protein n=1 Tax=Micromonospora sp. NPDC051300 TaxID=3364286 RepID=UPI0037A6DF43